MALCGQKLLAGVLSIVDELTHPVIAPLVGVS
jgi:hypothetical protein